MPHRETDTISLNAKETVAFLLSRGMSRKAILQALEEVAPERVSSNTSGRDLLPDHYLVPVSYAPLPPISELEKEFGKNNVSTLFDGRPWQKHSSCAKMDETQGERVMLVKRFGKYMTSEQAIAWGEENGYRSAIHLEAIAFGKAHPNLQRQFWIAACGSFAMGGDHRCVAALGGNGERRILDYYWFDGACGVSATGSCSSVPPLLCKYQNGKGGIPIVVSGQVKYLALGRLESLRLKRTLYL